MSTENQTRRRALSRRAIVYLVGAVSICSIEVGFVRASDLPLQPPPRQYSDSHQYYDEQLPPEEHYVYRRPAPYYSPPPIAYYGYAPAPPAFLVEPELNYLPPRYSYRYPSRGYGPYVARGYGRHDGRWARGYHRW